MTKFISKLVDRINLSESEAVEAMNLIMEGNATPAQIGSFVTALRMKGETIEELTGCARVMREKANHITPNVPYSIDTCGTGGDGVHTFNISTAAAFVAAAGGVIVAKHGNRSVSSKCGSADVLEALGLKITITPQQVEESIEKTGFGFMFAPSFHMSMKHAGLPRKEIGIRTVFNMLGPLTNPADVKGQVLGVYDKKLVPVFAQVLQKLGLERALVVHSMDGMDEISISAETYMAELKDGKISDKLIKPEEYGLVYQPRENIIGGDAAENAEIIKALFKGQKGAKRDVVLLNAAAALIVGKKADDFKTGIKLAAEIIDSGKASAKVEEVARFTNTFNS